MAITSKAGTIGWRKVNRNKEIAAPKGGDAMFTLLSALFCHAFRRSDHPVGRPCPGTLVHLAPPRLRSRWGREA
jgi:hypothetical protein